MHKRGTLILSRMVEGSSAEAVSSLAYVNASAHRASVVFSLADWPKTTSQVAMASGLSLSHASRAIHDLVGRGFVKCLTPELHGRGRLYGLTDDGQVLSDRLLRETRRPVTLPMIRASTPRAWYLALAEEVGSE